MTEASISPIRIVVMEGDGIGPEITAATVVVLRAAARVFNLALSFEPVLIGLDALRADGVRAGTAAPQQGHCGAQGECFADFGRTVSRMRARRGVTVSGRGVRGTHRRRNDGAARARCCGF